MRLHVPQPERVGTRGGHWPQDSSGVEDGNVVRWGTGVVQNRSGRVLGRGFMRNEVEGRQVDVDQAWSMAMAAAQSGDRIAYETLLRDCVPHVRRVVRRSGVRNDLVDDVVQDVLLTVHRARQTYDPTRSFKAWLSAIAQRRAIDMLRHRGRQDRREVFDEAEYDKHPDRAANPEEAWEDEAKRMALRDAVASLPAGQREAMESLAMRQLSLEEAADATGKTKGALKVNFHRALKALRLRSEKEG